MKTAISIPNTVFKQAELLAREMHLSRSALYAFALAEFIKLHQKEAVTQKLNAIYQKEASSIDKVLLNAQIQNFTDEKW